VNQHAQPSRTLYTTYRGHSRFARIRLRRPGHQLPLGARITALLPALRVPDEPADYTPELAMTLLGGTCELPGSKRALHIVLGEYRRALHALATQALAIQARHDRQPAAR
jgi:hypothetical protein